jgi:nucleotide-binding universal stress UspA family protein
MGVIVVGYVPKPEGQAALELSVTEAAMRECSLVVVNSHRGGREFRSGGAAGSEPELPDVRSQLEAAGVQHEIRQMVRGLEPAEDLLKVAEEVSAELIIIGLRRRSPVGKLILGSNAQRILLDAPCPVLAVKAGS